MSLAVLKSRALSGMDAPEVTVEVHLANGLPGFAILGLIKPWDFFWGFQASTVNSANPTFRQSAIFFSFNIEGFAMPRSI